MREGEGGNVHAREMGRGGEEGREGTGEAGGRTDTRVYVRICREGRRR